MTIYPENKDSQIEWIGKIPSHWEIKCIKFLLIEGKEGIKIGPFGSSLKLDKLASEGMKVYGQENVINDNFELGHRYISAEYFEDMFQYEIVPNDLLITMMGTTGKSQIVPEGIQKGIMDSHLIRLRVNTDTFIPKYLSQIIQESYSIGQNILLLGKGSIMHGLNSAIIKAIKIPVPPLPEQTAIANFLDLKTQQIDDLIARKERLIELLKEERTAVINQAVTKGLDPDVPMKDSGIEWLGEIPEHWEVKKIKYISRIVLGKMLTNEDKGGYHLKPYLRAQNINWFNANIDNVKSMWFSNKELKSYRISKYDLLVSEGGEVGRTCIWEEEMEECYIQNSVHKVTFSSDQSPDYFLNLFFVFGTKGHFDAIVSRVSIAHLTREKLKEIYVLVPPLDEQLSIFSFINTMSQNTMEHIEHIEKEINLLEEYKTSLINEAVTGKIDVRE